MVNSEITDISNNTIIEVTNAVYFENTFIFKSRIFSDLSCTPSISDIPSSSSAPATDPEPRRSKITRILTSFDEDFFTYFVEGDLSSFKEAIDSSKSPFWKEAIDSEIKSIMENTWTLPHLPPRCKHVSCKWVFKKKLRPDGTVDKYKARLVTKSFTQQKGIDFFDTYSPVIRISSIRILLTLATIHNMFIHQIIVKTAFLNGDFEEEIYMGQPKGFIAKRKENKVCKLVKLLYVLKQAPKQWHQNLTKLLHNLDSLA